MDDLPLIFDRELALYSRGAFWFREPIRILIFAKNGRGNATGLSGRPLPSIGTAESWPILRLVDDPENFDPFSFELIDKLVWQSGYRPFASSFNETTPSQIWLSQ